MQPPVLTCSPTVPPPARRAGATPDGDARAPGRAGPASNAWSALRRCAILAGVYFAAAKAGLSLAYIHPNATAVWPPTGIAIAAVLLWGHRVWPGIALGAFLVNASTAGTSLLSAVGIGVGNTLEALLAGALVNRFAGGRRFPDRAWHVFCFVVLAAALSTTVSATVGVASLYRPSGSWKYYADVWLTWWLGDAVGALVITPLLVAWTTPPDWFRRPGRWLEGLGLLCLLVLVGQTVFRDWPRSAVPLYPQVYMVIPFVIWAAVRFGPRGATATILVLSGIAIWNSVERALALGDRTENLALLGVQTFIAVVALTGLTLAAVTTEQHATQEQLRTSLCEKEVLLREIHHRVKNNLQVVTSLLNLQASRVSDPRTLDLLRETQGRIKTMALIHEGFYGARNLAQIHFGQFVRNLAADVHRAHARGEGEVQLELDVPDLTLPLDTAIPCGLILNELVANALKHAFPAGRPGTLRIVLTATANQWYKLTVSDNGVGIPDPVRLPQSPSLGLSLVRGLVAQLGGTVEIERAAGTRFVIHFNAEPKNKA